MPTFTALDWAVVAAYFVGVFTIAILVARRRQTTATASNYFLAGRNVGWLVIGASLFASNIGSEHLVGLAGTGANSGVAVGQFEILAALILLVLGWVFVPFYLRSGVFTMPEFLERRYSSGARWYLAIVSIIAYVLTKISVTVAAGGIVFEGLLGLSFWTGAIVVVIGTGLYTVFGGLKAVLYTDLMQAVILILGSVVVTLVGLNEVGGVGALRAELPSGFLDMWKPMQHPDFPWTGILLGAPILGVWYWCTDQFIVQRVLSARDVHEARRGTIFAGFLKLLPVFIFVFPGLIALALKNQGKLDFGSDDEAFVGLVGGLLPTGFRGLVAAGLLAALMSSLSSVFNSCSTLVTWDIYRKLRPDASERQLVVVGQGATILLVILGIAWIPFMADISAQLYKYLQSVQAYISPPIAAAFLIGIFYKRANGAGALASFAVGFVLGMGRLVLELRKESLDGLLRTVAEINFLHFALLLFVVCSVVLVVVSLCTAPVPESKLRGLTFATTPRQEEEEAERAPRRKERWLALLLLVLVGAVWILFS